MNHSFQKNNKLVVLFLYTVGSDCATCDWLQVTWSNGNVTHVMKTCQQVQTLLVEVGLRGDYHGWFHNRDTIAIVKQQSQYYSMDTITIVWMHLALAFACVVYGGQSCSQCYRYTSMWRGTLHAARLISPLFQLNDAKMLPCGGFPVHILTISNSSSFL